MIARNETLARGLDEIAADLARDRSIEDLPALMTGLLAEATDCYQQNLERGGLYDEVRTLAPRLDPTLRRLAGRHRQILERLAWVTEELENRPAKPWLGAVKKGLVRMMVEHGRAEREAVLEAYLRKTEG